MDICSIFTMWAARLAGSDGIGAFDAFGMTARSVCKAELSRIDRGICVWRKGQGCPLELTRHKDGSIGMSLAQAVVKGHMRSKCLGLEVSYGVNDLVRREVDYAVSSLPLGSSFAARPGRIPSLNLPFATPSPLTGRRMLRNPHYVP